jgi:hypothetical protein
MYICKIAPCRLMNSHRNCANFPKKIQIKKFEGKRKILNFQHLKKKKSSMRISKQMSYSTKTCVGAANY